MNLSSLREREREQERMHCIHGERERETERRNKLADRAILITHSIHINFMELRLLIID